jgi:hypothetical protein
VAASKPPSPRSTKATTVRGKGESDIAICKKIHVNPWKSCNSHTAEKARQSDRSAGYEFFRVDELTWALRGVYVLLTTFIMPAGAVPARKARMFRSMTGIA